MKMIEQPESYSDMLVRIFYLTLGSGLICTLILAYVSPEVKSFLNLFNIEVEIGPFKGLKALYVVTPLVIAGFSRVLLLHDKISNLLRIRFIFDTHFILFPMARMTSHQLTKDLKKRIRTNRKPAMYKVFYEYAGFDNPSIDKQLVRTALDNWGWFWVMVESTFLFSLTTLFLEIFYKDAHGMLLLLSIIILIELGFLLNQWFVCQKSADREVRAILDDQERKSAVRDYFTSCGKSLTCPP